MSSKDTTYEPTIQEITLGSSPIRSLDKNELATLRKLASIGSSDTEICHILKVHRQTLYKYQDIIDEGKAILHGNLRRAQVEKALIEKDSRMLIWLGKQMLGQTDKLDTTTEHSIKPEIVIYDDAIYMDKSEKINCLDLGPDDEA